MKFDDLTVGQKEAFEIVIEAIRTKKHHVMINGPAGTGKTTMTKFILEHLVRNGELGIMLAAPTHQAKKVLSKLSGHQAATIHSILKISPTTYEAESIFEQKEMPDLAKCRVLLCDEGSMYDGPLFKILMNTIPSHCTVIGIGDEEQLRPVAPGESIPAKSPFFSDPRFKQVTLTEVKRSNGPIIKVATEIRNGGWFRECIEDGHGFHGFNGDKPLQQYMMKYFDVVKSPEDLFETRMLAYTNKSVDKLNGIIRRKLYETESPFIVGEVLVMQEPYMKSLEFDGKKFNEIIFNNGQMVRILDCKLTSTFLKARDVSVKQMISYWHLEVETVDEDDDYQRETIKVLADDNEKQKFDMFLAKVATTYRELKSAGRRPHWADFWDAKRTFLKVKALPCSTIHKSQGISVDNAFIYTPCITLADIDLAKQLAYVSSTRARHDVYFV
ncbi:DNA helicase [Erwinia phage Virsaitis27]|nr:DNA helicase [Erwinia phage Virsaitis27]